jgi:tRNA (guanine37-N1)-methyltransferase
MMKLDVITLFPDLFSSWCQSSLIAAGQKKDKFSIKIHDLKEFSGREDGRIDDRPFGGGPGMIFKAEVILKALRQIEGWQEATKIHLCPAGEPFKQARAMKESQKDQLILLCSRYEGVDQRALDLGGFEDVSMGDYVSMGGEMPAMVMMEAILRLKPGVLGHELSALEDSFSPGRKGLLDCCHYTRPASFEGQDVPEVLLSGDHEKIKEWRENMALKRSTERRRDLLQ